ncbi:MULTISPECIES: IclR family transcriptional regulator [Microbacterium]|uniref:IclR family transcriptional regulator n=1 Tax=Microbacterium sp. MMO-10 TaxID=3081272 RepID=UPI0030159E3E
MNTGVLLDDEDVLDPGASERVITVRKSLQLLESIADRGGCTAKELSDILRFSLPTVYRLAQELVANGYLVHLKSERRFELGYKLHGLGLSLHQQLGVSGVVRSAIDTLHNGLGMASYYAIYRGADVVLTYVSDCAEHPRLTPLRFGFHEAAHATAFGKIMLAAMSIEQRDDYLSAHRMPSLTSSTITDQEGLERVLSTVALRGIAWERDEFISGKTCAAVGVRDPSGLVVGAVAISMDTPATPTNDARVEHSLREHALALSKHYRSGANQLRLA